ncbi:hypothetical protein LG284_16415 (plasmid) [Citricoccus nitrophenolicus]
MTPAQLATTQLDLTWLPSLIAGLIGTVIGAGVALFVLHRTLRHQREQNIRARLTDSTAAFLTAIRDLASILSRHPSPKRDFQTAFTDAVIHLERIHLDLRDVDARIYHSLHALLHELNTHCREAARHGRIRLADHDRQALISLSTSLGTVLAEWVRATTPDRRAHNEQLLCDIAEIVRDQGLDGWRTLDRDAR